MFSEFQGLMQGFYITQIKGTCGKAEFDVQSVPGKWQIQAGYTGWWLNGAHRVSAQGSFDYCCVNKACKLTNVGVEWKWHDEIDAYNFIEALNEYEKIAEDKNNSWWDRRGISFWLTFEAGVDIIGDKIMDTDFYVKVNWDEPRQEMTVTR